MCIYRLKYFCGCLSPLFGSAFAVDCPCNEDPKITFYANPCKLHLDFVLTAVQERHAIFTRAYLISQAYQNANMLLDEQNPATDAQRQPLWDSYEALFKIVRDFDSMINSPFSLNPDL